MGSKTSRLAGDNPNNNSLPPATHQHDQSTDSFNQTNSETHNSTSTSTHNSSIQTTTTTNSIIIDEEMYQQLINHANLNAPAHLLPPQRVTYSKIKNCVLFEDIHNDEYIMERYSMCLSDPKSMLETYLNLDNTITKQWDEKVRMLESEMMSSAGEDEHIHENEEKTENVSSENTLSNNSSSLNATLNHTVKKKNAKNMHLFSPQFYEIIASAKATTEKTLNESDSGNEENLLESEKKELDEILSFDVGLSQMDFENSSSNMIQENVAKVFEGLSNNITSQSETADDSSNQTNKKEVKWSDEILDLANSNNNTPIKKPTSNSVSNTPNLHSNHTPITALTTSIVMDQVLMTPPQFINNSSNTPSNIQQSTPGSNLTRSSAAADIPRDLTLSHHGIESNSANIGASMTSAGLSESFAGTSNNTQGSFTENLSEDNLKDWWRSNPTLEKSIKIKLIVTDMHHHNKTKQTIRQIVSPLLSPVKILPAFGMFHTALVISEFKLEWTDSSLCIPRKLSSQSSFFSADIEEITTAHDLEDIVKKLSEVICRWNTTMIYSERKRKKKSKKPKKSSKSLKNYVNTGNCQDFIFDILDSIGKREVLENLLNSDSPMGQYMRDMRKYGRCQMEIKLNPAFREKFSIKEKVKKFLTHSELDLFVKQLETKDPDFKHNHKNEWILLKGFDRAFWIRHLAFKDNPDMRPLYEKQENVFEMTDLDMSDSTLGCCEVLACPFDDPQKTMSIILKN